jgi:hypothetical protein
MKRASVPLFVLALAVAMAGLTGCEEDVGLPCSIAGGGGADGGAANIRINAQSLECRSRACLLYGTVPEARPLCTKTCDSASDCPDSLETCEEGFACVRALQTGPFACCKMCVCKRYIINEENPGATSTCKELMNDPTFELSCPSL